MTKDEFRLVLRERLDNIYRKEKMNFDEITCGGSRMLFDMRLSLMGNNQDENDYTALMSIEEYNNRKYDDVIDELYNEEVEKYKEGVVR